MALYLTKSTRVLKRQSPITAIFYQQKKHKLIDAINSRNYKGHQQPDKVHGSYHWNLERVTAITLAPLIGSGLVLGPSGITDVLLGVILPFHIHMGFDSCITDYFNPTRTNPLIYKAMTMTLHTSTLLTMIGCAAFNYNDIGMTALITRLWTA